MTLYRLLPTKVRRIFIKYFGNMNMNNRYSWPGSCSNIW